ncbi:hypothetical protein FHX37_4229 [Haloactinospora alba]|uniref:Membrane protein YgcG n=1 Tax=Haloactinospora alba TaxID=405555 RepID=A0A543N6R2_9ACTN|nr:hypothetical protein [Haloactinospora alba]TQN27508.1 hypothetical protein FHX37_4229 [Haloactinospora alba]
MRNARTVTSTAAASLCACMAGALLATQPAHADSTTGGASPTGAHTEEELDEIALALREDPLYVAPEQEDQFPRQQRENARDALEGTDTPVYVVVAPLRDTNEEEDGNEELLTVAGKVGDEKGQFFLVDDEGAMDGAPTEAFQAAQVVEWENDWDSAAPLDERASRGAELVDTGEWESRFSDLREAEREAAEAAAADSQNPRQLRSEGLAELSVWVLWLTPPAVLLVFGIIFLTRRLGKSTTA